MNETVGSRIDRAFPRESSRGFGCIGRDGVLACPVRGGLADILNYPIIRSGVLARARAELEVAILQVLVQEIDASLLPELRSAPPAILDAILEKLDVKDAGEAIRDVLARWTEIDTGDEILDARMDRLRRAFWGPSSLGEE